MLHSCKTFEIVLAKTTSKLHRQSDVPRNFLRVLSSAPFCSVSFLQRDGGDPLDTVSVQTPHQCADTSRTHIPLPSSHPLPQIYPLCSDTTGSKTDTNSAITSIALRKASGTLALKPGEDPFEPGLPRWGGEGEGVYCIRPLPPVSASRKRRRREDIRGFQMVSGAKRDSDDNREILFASLGF